MFEFCVGLLFAFFLYVVMSSFEEHHKSGEDKEVYQSKRDIIKKLREKEKEIDRLKEIMRYRERKYRMLFDVVKRHAEEKWKQRDREQNGSQSSGGDEHKEHLIS